MKRVLALQQLDLTPPTPIEAISGGSCLLLSCNGGGGDNNNGDNNNGGNNNGDNNNG